MGRRKESLVAAAPVFSPVFALKLLYTRQEAAAALSVSASTLDELRKSVALLKPVKVGRRPLWPLKNLLAYIDQLMEAGDLDDPWGNVRV